MHPCDPLRGVLFSLTKSSVCSLALTQRTDALNYLRSFPLRFCFSFSLFESKASFSFSPSSKIFFSPPISDVQKPHFLFPCHCKSLPLLIATAVVSSSLDSFTSVRLLTSSFRDQLSRSSNLPNIPDLPGLSPHAFFLCLTSAIQRFFSPLGAQASSLLYGVIPSHFFAPDPPEFHIS